MLDEKYGYGRTIFTTFMLLSNISSTYFVEADYAWTKRRNALIFCRIERGFKPLGQLGLILGSAFYFDFSKYTFEYTMQKLLDSVHHLWQKRGLNMPQR